MFSTKPPLSLKVQIPNRVLALCFDMDGCLADDLFYPGLLRRHPFVMAALDRLLALVNVTAFNQVVICPSTNRKDQASDAYNAEKNHTPRTAEVLTTLAGVLDDLLGDKGVAVRLDTRLHVDRLFCSEGKDKPLDYANEISSMVSRLTDKDGPDKPVRLPEFGRDAGKFLFSKQSGAGKDKIDVVLTLVNSLASEYNHTPSQPITVVMFDDLFLENDHDSSVRSLRNILYFFSDYSKYLPQNMNLIAMRLDPFDVKQAIDQSCGEMALRCTFLKTCVAKLSVGQRVSAKHAVADHASENGYSFGDRPADEIFNQILSTQDSASDMNDNLMVEFQDRLFECVVAPNPDRMRAYNDLLLQARLSYLDNLSESRRSAFLNQMIAHVDTCRGDAEEIYDVTAPRFWGRILIPGSEHYQFYVANRVHEEGLEAVLQRLFLSK